ncbi:hypothetical protein D9611_008370 [Ephemerocybe angulata]|uniref:Uncharacterized protein n=1 Tax=Ephemerocybe angulata TaxID=980116 RepID=A0A8H5F502_9AGAR|nr:hypothetical protein D9611_008370 [Tulosesus angulatus]
MIYTSTPASVIEHSLLSSLYAFASVLNALPSITAVLSGNYSMHPIPSPLEPPSTPSSPSSLQTAQDKRVWESCLCGCIFHRLPSSSTFDTVALLGLSTTPKTWSRSLASGFQFTLSLIGIPLAVWTLEKATPRYLCHGKLVLDRLTSKVNQRHHFIRVILLDNDPYIPIGLTPPHAPYSPQLCKRSPCICHSSVPIVDVSSALQQFISSHSPRIRLLF